MLKEEQFHETILITTTALDAGVNINDDSLSKIVCDVKDTTSLIQCIGRKRLKDNKDKINLYIKTIDNRSLGGTKTKLKKKRAMAEFLFHNTPEEYAKKYQRENDNSCIVYLDNIEGESEKVTLKVNEMMYSKTLLDILETEKMLKKGKLGYCKFLAEHFGFYDKDFDKYDYEILEVVEEEKSLADCLEGIVSQVMLTLNDRKELIEKINVKQDGKLLRSLESLNVALREKKIDFYIKQFETSRMIDGKKKKYKSAWKVMKLDE